MFFLNLVSELIFTECVLKNFGSHCWSGNNPIDCQCCSHLINSTIVNSIVYKSDAIKEAFNKESIWSRPHTIVSEVQGLSSTDYWNQPLILKKNNKLFFVSFFNRVKRKDACEFTTSTTSIEFWTCSLRATMWVMPCVSRYYVLIIGIDVKIGLGRFGEILR